jgi:type IV pilus assembly protein PilX
MNLQRNTQGGAALVVGLLLLVILTLLAVSGMNTASTELVMAGNEQFRQGAFQAAETGVEREIATLDENDQDAIPSDREYDLGTTRVETTVTYRGRGPVQNYGNDFRGYHYDIRSVGTGARNASATHLQGAYFVNQAGNAGEEGPLDPANPELE